MVDNSENVPNVQIFKGAEQSTPVYLRQFLTETGVCLSSSLERGDEAVISAHLGNLAKTLPKDTTFKEIATLICRRRNGDLFVTNVEGDLEQIEAKVAGSLLDDLVQEVPLDTEQILFLHTHPSVQSPIGPIPSSEVGFSEADKSFLKQLGGKLRVLDLSDAYVGLATANSSKIILEKGQNDGKAFGWSFP